MPKVASILALALLLLGGVGYFDAKADIYRYEDEEGVVHFTDAPTDKRFKIFMRDIKRDRKLRTTFKLARFTRDPAEFEPIITQCAQEFGVDRSLVKAVIHAESGYNPNAVSPKGASGLMQLMPKTARDLKVANSLDPRENIRGGVRYLRFLLDTFRGDESLALAAYNAGLSRVAQYNGIPPYQETRTYVDRVLTYRKSYQTTN
ncbi:lytic transglycosylase domain-containing protein [Geobacter hydrogenophilus]|uniref:Lytic transglycosylase n=1 Tax=Geobacter hydrogenophilus TaxID=40983 RepID=A0A9W6G289_9BACT|nr:lytic transglycosylase domain-containing protein [Geobacter hydrogenophilus]MBT0892978.1 lytic transglycosylase domain-containing protein [Geobacter hydrogenophilus]GLI39186.1 lytic transglycosylase [Geobacter hydrogenophilus]